MEPTVYGWLRLPPPLLLLLLILPAVALIRVAMRMQQRGHYSSQLPLSDFTAVRVHLSPRLPHLRGAAGRAT